MTLLRAAITALALLAPAACTAGAPAWARDNGQYAQISPDIKRWVEGLKDANGHGCCATADGFLPEEVEWDTNKNGYRVRLGGEWYDVPEGAVLTEPNRLGYAVVWYYVEDDYVAIRCFLPGGGA